MNQLVQGLLTRFTADQAMVGRTESEAFERLAAWCVLASELPSGSSLEEVMAGNETVGIDSLAVIANGDLILDEQDADDACAAGKAVDADFVFIQAKTSEKFDRVEILGFGDAVADFFSTAPGLKESAFISERRRAKDKLYQHSSQFRNRRPRVKMWYVTTGQLVQDQNLENAFNGVCERLRATSLFETVEFDRIGAGEVHRRFTSAENRGEATFNYGRRVPLPKISGIKEAYLGLVSAKEFLKLIEDSDGKIRTSVFYDNVRDFQDMNTVNQGMLETLQDPDTALLFPVLNNGVTVVAQELRLVGEEVTAVDYQIVNGCQTSHVIHAARAHVNDDILVPLRLVVTEQDQVTGAITKATNRQTPVDEGSLQALTDFQKELEAYFSGQVDKRRLYYERRSRQYAGQSVEQTRVISPMIQMRAFAAFALDEPHSASRYYRKLFERVPSEVFSPEHRHDAYYTAALAWYRLDVALRRQLIDPKYRLIRYHILMVIKYLGSKTSMPALNSNKLSAYCEGLNLTLVDEQKSVDLFKRAAELIFEVGGDALTRDTIKGERFTRDLLASIRDRSA